MPSSPLPEQHDSEELNPGLSRLSLGRKNQRLHFERRIHLWLSSAAFAIMAPASVLVFEHTSSLALAVIAAALVALIVAILAHVFIEQLVRPLQTLSNVVAALREDDYSFRARGARRGDAIGDLALELNALAASLQQQRSAAHDALTLLERVVTSMHSPVLAFDAYGNLRLINTAATQAFSLDRDMAGRPAPEMHFAGLLAVPDQGLYPPEPPDSLTSTPTRWSVRRTTFRLHGLPHTLLVLSDVAAVLREEERLAWQRLIRVLSHEINNSLTPIKSIAGSLRTRLNALDPEDADDFSRGLSVIEERAASLNRFLQAYQRLTHLPAPNRQPTPVANLAARTAQLETRLPIAVLPGPELTLLCDCDQIQQALINLLRNAVDAALDPGAAQPGRTPEVTLTWLTTPTDLLFLVEDNGLGIDNPSNLFVPFYTTKPAGSGIGLVLVQQIASAHGGAVRLLPRPAARGCLAEFRLPLS